jgi:DnaJ like chaperone protein
MLKDLLNQNIPVADVCSQISRNMDYSSRLQLLQLLYSVSMADGSVHPSEILVIDSIAENIGISRPDQLSIKNMFVPETDSSYRILEIERTATNDDVKKAYRRMAMKYHPDKVNHLGEEFKKTADEKFRKVNEAYEKIKKERNMV